MESNIIDEASSDKNKNIYVNISTILRIMMLVETSKVNIGNNKK